MIGSLDAWVGTLRSRFRIQEGGNIFGGIDFRLLADKACTRRSWIPEGRSISKIGGAIGSRTANKTRKSACVAESYFDLPTLSLDRSVAEVLIGPSIVSPSLERYQSPSCLGALFESLGIVPDKTPDIHCCSELQCRRIHDDRG